MKKVFILLIVMIIGLLSNTVYSQTQTTVAPDSALLGLPGDNLDLYAVLDLFQNSKTIEEFEKSLNLEKTGVNNLDLNLDNKVDFIKVVTEKKDDDFTFILQVAVNEKETQDVAVILVSKDKDKKVTMQIVGDPDLYGKDYIVELKEKTTPSVTPNPGYSGPDTVYLSQPATTTTVVVESTPIVQYVYSPAYVPYYPPYYYGYYPPYYAAFTVMAVGMYWGAHAHYHGGYYGGGYHGNTVVVHNHNTYNNYNSRRNTSNTVNHNRANGNYNRGNNSSAATRPSTGNSPSTRPSAGNTPSTRPSAGNSPSTRPSAGNTPSTRPSSGTSPSTRQSDISSSYNRPSNNAASSPGRSSGNYSSSNSRSNSNGASRYSSGSRGYSGGGSRGGGGGSRGGGGRR